MKSNHSGVDILFYLQIFGFTVHCSSKHNVIVGRNGSGKSNFFDAIQFVLLGPRFASLRQEERQQLLHEGAGSSVMAAYVEIIFDNSDGRLSVDSDEVVLRRTVGLKKDEFFLNRRRVQKSEVQNLLESAGFSKSNPYYIVQQGKVANLCTMTDKDRLTLLKEIAGTTIYEDRRAESLKIMQDSSNKQDRILEVLSFIEERLAELEQEKEELSEYDQLDKDRRALEFTLYDNEQRKASEQLKDIEVTRDEERIAQQSLYESLCKLEDAKQAIEDELVNAKESLSRLQMKVADKHHEMQSVVSTRAALEADVLEAEAHARARTEELSQIRSQLEEVNKRMSTCNSELARIEPDYADKSMHLQQTLSEIERTNAQVEALYGKQGRGRQFSSKKERDAFLQTQIASISAQLKSKDAMLVKLRAEVAAEETRLARERTILTQAEAERRGNDARLEELSVSLQRSGLRRNELQETRKSCWREMETLQETIQERKTDLDKAKHQLNSAMPRAISQGLSVVEEYAEANRLEGYYGPLIDNFRLKNEAFRTAVEIAAGNSLFHIVVDSDTTAALLMKELERKKVGRLTFLPLNRLRNPPITYPDSSDVKPLMDVALEYAPEFEEAIRQVFGKKLLARDLDVAAHFSKEFQLDAITKDGDQVNRKGGFEGGFHDDRTSRFSAVMKIRDVNAQLSSLITREDELKQAVDRADNDVNALLREIQKTEAERQHLKTNMQTASREFMDRNKSLHIAADNLDERKRGIQNLESDIAASNRQIEAFTMEKSSPLSGQLSESEQAELVRLIELQRSLLANRQTHEAEVMQISDRRNKLKADLSGNLSRRHHELDSQLSNLLSETSGEAASGSSRRKSKQMFEGDVELGRLESERNFLMVSLTALKAEVEALELSVDAKRAEVNQLDKQLDTHNTKEQGLQTQLAEAAKRQDKLLNKWTMLVETVQLKQRKIRDLGTLPRKEYEQCKGFGEKKLLDCLHRTNEGLKKFASVNKKALEQYVSFNEQREVLLSRKEELSSDSDAIKQLVDSLDAQKEEAIARTFRGVSQHFSDVFKELVPDGHAELIMRTSMDEGDDESSDEETTAPATEPAGSSSAPSQPAKKGASKAKSGKSRASDASSASSGVVASSAAKDILFDTAAVSNFRGVQVRVTFSGAGQQFEMQQLSGGQKALVALAIIFAIQRCDPAPFYLFDEIDQALDANYRAGVARLIQKQVESKEAPAQFITTTFRPEFVAVANKCYGIALHNKVSNIYTLDKSSAQNFVTDLMNEEEAVGKVSAMPKYAVTKRRQPQELESEIAGESEEEEDRAREQPSDSGSESGAPSTPIAERRGVSGRGPSINLAAARRSTGSGKVLTTKTSTKPRVSKRMISDVESEEEESEQEQGVEGNEPHADEQEELEHLQMQVEEFGLAKSGGKKPQRAAAASSRRGGH